MRIFILYIFDTELTMCYTMCYTIDYVNPKRCKYVWTLLSCSATSNSLQLTKIGVDSAEMFSEEIKTLL